MTRRTKVLFLCTGNSCRSQMAEAFTRHFHGDVIEAYSAGIDVRGLDPLAVEVMAELGLDISGQISKRVEELEHIGFDYVVTVCDHAQETCPVFPAATTVFHRDFADPPRLAAHAASKAEALAHYRRVRDEIRDYVASLPGTLAGRQ